MKTQGVIIDVRSEGEFNEAHIPGAVSVPLLSNIERAEVGTLYKEQGAGPARLRGLQIVEPKLEKLFDGIALAAARGLDAPAIQIPKPRHWAEAFKIVSRQILEMSFDEDIEGESIAVEGTAPLEQPTILGSRPIIFYCWRGGAVSKSMALFARALGFNAGFIVGGHKAFRREALK